MRRSLFLLSVATAALAVACSEPTGPRSGGIALRLTGAGAAGQAAAGTLDSIRVSVAGPTNKSVSFACSAATCSGTVDALDPGTYSVTVAGVVGGAVDHYGTVSSVTVTGGQNATATVSNWGPFVPTLTSPDTVEVLQFPVAFSKIAAATSYVLEWSQAADFTGSQSQTLTDTSATITVTTEGQYYVRVRAVNANVGSDGRTSVPQAVFAFQGVATVSIVPATANIAAGATQRFTAYGLDANSDTVPNVTWYWASSNPSIATVNQSGLATGVAGAGGKVTITAVGKGQPGNAALTVGAQTPTKLAFSVQPTSAVAGASISPAVQVEVRDANNNLVTTARSPVTVGFGTNAGSGTLAGTKVVNAINGIASFSGLWVDKTGTGYTLAATSGSLTGATSSTFNVTAGAPTKLGFAVAPSNVLGNAAITPAVQVSINDFYGNATTATDQVTVAIPTTPPGNPWASPFVPGGGGGTLSGTLTIAAVNGVATFSDLAIDRPGLTYQLVATSGALQTSSAPFQVNLQAQQPSSFYLTTCAQMSSGTYCWGYNGYGELGTGSFSYDSVPALVQGGHTFVQVASGYYHSCGLTAAGAAYCWGYNGYGSLGDGSNTQSLVPVAVAGGHVFSTIAAGYAQTCGLTTADNTTAAEDRQVYCWGYNGYGQLGDNSTASSNTPVQVAQPLQSTTHATQLSLGYYHSCARAADSHIYCWGLNSSGQLGDNTVINRLVPVSTSSGTWSMVAAGWYHTCGINVSGEAFCWGANGNGQVGDNSTTNRPAPTDVGLAMLDIAAGGYHSCGILAADNTGWCWGSNGNGQLGDSTQTDRHSPVQVLGGLTFDKLEGGAWHTCGLKGTDLYCWGRDYEGELGNGSRAIGSLLAPVQIVQ